MIGYGSHRAHLTAVEAGRPMRATASRTNRRVLRFGWLLLAVGWALLAAPGLPLGAPAACAASSELSEYQPQNGLDPGCVDLYNQHFSAWMQAHPEDPLGSASDAAAYLFGEFDRLSVIDVELFADQSRFDSRSKLTPDPAVRQAFEDRADQTNRLADAALARNPSDANALYAKTLVCGMRSDYALMIEKRDLEALSYSKQATALSRQTLALQPTMYDAYMASRSE